MVKGMFVSNSSCLSCFIKSVLASVYYNNTPDKIQAKLFAGLNVSKLNKFLN